MNHWIINQFISICCFNSGKRTAAKRMSKPSRRVDADADGGSDIVQTESELLNSIQS